MLDIVGQPLPQIFLTLLLSIGALAVAISVHESSHAWMANRLGDPTARNQGRISLNPINHIDLFGTIILPLLLILLNTGILFGWAKPTPFNPWNLKNPRRDAALISLAGPAANIVLALVFGITLRFLSGDGLLELVLFRFTVLNLVLAFFNLLPIAPLDGFKVVGGILPRALAYQWETLENLGPILLLFLFFFGNAVLSRVLGFFVGIFFNAIVGPSLTL